VLSSLLRDDPPLPPAMAPEPASARRSAAATSIASRTGRRRRRSEVGSSSSTKRSFRWAATAETLGGTPSAAAGPTGREPVRGGPRASILRVAPSGGDKDLCAGYSGARARATRDVGGVGLWAASGSWRPVRAAGRGPRFADGISKGRGATARFRLRASADDEFCHLREQNSSPARASAAPTQAVARDATPQPADTPEINAMF
jgi:hypothetical protein